MVWVQKYCSRQAVGTIIRTTLTINRYVKEIPTLPLVPAVQTGCMGMPRSPASFRSAF